MRILIACGKSAIVHKQCEMFRAKGHKAYSCDLQPSDCNSPWHIKCNVLNILNDGWNEMIGHPPCTFLCVSGARWLYDPKYPTRLQDQDKAVKFFMQLYNAPIEKIALENPVGVISTRFRKPDQIIQPYEFGHNAVKKTCLWLKNLPSLRKKLYEITFEKDPYFIHNLGGGNSDARSVSFLSIAMAMVDQWS